MSIKQRFVQQLNHAFETIQKADGSLYTPDEVQAVTGITASYIWRLRKGRIDNPTINVIGLLADFFGVRPSYFVDRDVAAEESAQVPRLMALAQERLGHCSERELEFLVVMMDQLENLRAS